VSRHVRGWKEPPIRDEAALFDIIDVLVDIADARGISGAQVALAWLLAGRR
jgi:aryl-alcohol dehydrogenase-like predicted oxidoreductase